MSLKSQYADLKASFGAQPPDLPNCGRLLTQLKLGLIQAGLLIPQGDLNPADLVVVCEILEIGAFWSIRTQDVPSFDWYFSQLQAFYTDYATLPPSQHEYAIRGLHLIRLLTQNRIADFHTALESLPAAAVESPYIAHPVNLERWLMEGSYAKYGYFVDSLMGTIRNGIASCEEAAYESLPLKDTATLLFFTSQRELLVFAEQRGWEVNLTLGTITFAKKGEETMDIPKETIIAASLLYARELEQIV
ncbi:SAC3/GANP/Nin1/mts3/eIF-3 p25 family-domain-containing protein [Mycena galopus ATCC 62051]|nr:SAC3/GANP/Nin1/mts3/eIF-3 p25 family-domain-containing protein [Mycena galopus ATCC 62051]